MELIRVENFTFKYRGASVKTLDNMSFSAHEGELVLLCGGTASGKTTLLRSLKPEIAPNGVKSGKILFCGTELSSLDKRSSAREIGFVMQRPENQIVTDRVRSELAFGCENLSLSRAEIQRRIAEVSAFFNISELLGRSTDTLSGGQLQMLCLASVIAMKPRLLLLDEPTAQLDPIAAGEFIRDLYRITRELGVTVIVAEHRFTELLPLSDRVLFLEKGDLTEFDSPSSAAEVLVQSDCLRESLPCGIRLRAEHELLSKSVKPPLKFTDSRKMLSENFELKGRSLPKPNERCFSETAIHLKNIRFVYEKKSHDIISGASLSIKRGECFALLGSNGSGKSTLLSVISGIKKPYLGTIEILGQPLKKVRDKIGLLPQDVRCTFLYDTVREELGGDAVTDFYDFTSLLNMHPFDLSGGQAQLLGLAKLMRRGAEIVLLDEPTKGLDGSFKQRIIGIIRQLSQIGKTVVIVTHDTELAALTADRCGIFFDGEVMSVAAPQELFADGLFFTTEAARLSRGICSNVVTYDQLSEICRGALSIGGDSDER